MPVEPVRYAEWGGLECEVRIRDSAHLRVLALVFRQNAFLSLVDLDAEGPVERDGAITLAEAFRARVRDRSRPEAAFVVANVRSRTWTISSPNRSPPSSRWTSWRWSRAHSGWCTCRRRWPAASTRCSGWTPGTSCRRPKVG